MWWILLFMDNPEDLLPGFIIAGILVGLLLLGFWIWGPDDMCNTNKQATYDTIQNDSVIILKKSGYYVFDTIGETDSTIILKKRMVYN